MHLRAIRKPKHGRQLRIREPILLVVDKVPNHIRINRAAPLVHQRDCPVLLVEGRTGLHPEAVGAVRPGDLRPQDVRSAVDGLRDAPVALQESQGDLRGLVAGVAEARFAAGDHVELVVGEL